MFATFGDARAAGTHGLREDIDAKYIGELNPFHRLQSRTILCTILHMSSPDRTRMQSDVLRLTFACPHGLENPDCCPLHGVRALDEAGRSNWVLRLNDEELEYLTAYHQVCLQLNLAHISHSL